MNLVSVILPVYNRALFLRRSISSILEAGYECIEVLIVDDGSCDGSLELAKEFEYSHPEKFRVFIHPHHANLGVSASRNLGIKSAKGRYICFLDSDDVMLPGRFDVAVCILDKYSEIDGVYEAAEVFSDENECIATLVPGKRVDFEKQREIYPEPIGMISTGGILVRRDIFQKTGFFDVNRWVGEDIHMWFRMLTLGKLVPGSDLPVVRYYKHSGNTSGFDVADVELGVVADVYRWSRFRSIEKTKIEYLVRTYKSLLYHYLSEVRKSKKSIRLEFRLLVHPMIYFNRCIFDRNYIANLYRLLIRMR